MEATVLIACLNGRAHLAETLDALVDQEWDRRWEIVFADNGSTDGSRELFDAYAAGRECPTMRSLDASQRPGKAYALNVGTEAAAAPAILICDADDVPAPGWLAAMGEALRHHDLVAATSDLQRLNKAPTGIYRGVPQNSIYRQRFAPYAECVPGFAVGFTRALWTAIGGFREEFPIEDDEFCVRAALRGYRPHPVGEAVMHHRLRDDLRAIFWQAYGYSLTDVAVAKEYRGFAPAQSRPWLGLVQQARKVSRSVLGVTVGRSRHSMAEMARVCWRAGALAGQIAGVMRYRSTPTVGQPVANLEVQDGYTPRHAG